MQKGARKSNDDRNLLSSTSHNERLSGGIVIIDEKLTDAPLNTAPNFIFVGRRIWLKL